MTKTLELTDQEYLALGKLLKAPGAGSGLTSEQSTAIKSSLKEKLSFPARVGDRVWYKGNSIEYSTRTNLAYVGTVVDVVDDRVLFRRDITAFEGYGDRSYLCDPNRDDTDYNRQQTHQTHMMAPQSRIGVIR